LRERALKEPEPESSPRRHSVLAVFAKGEMGIYGYEEGKNELLKPVDL
jgi:hypothetical protein